ncbi:MAG: hypothetical protein ABIV50_00790 [Opitutus sp.]
MNYREPTSTSYGVGRAFACLALLLLPLLSGAHASAWPQLLPPAGLTQPTTYLVALGAPPLRFQEAASTVALATRPPIPGSSRIATVDTSSAELDVSLRPELEKPADFHAALTAQESVSPLASEAEPSTRRQAKVPMPILPDETRSQARPEDFLPFFQIPATQPGDVNVIVSAPRAPANPSSLPLSSATYTQTPR